MDEENVAPALQPFTVKWEDYSVELGRLMGLAFESRDVTLILAVDALARKLGIHETRLVWARLSRRYSARGRLTD
jgi:hypothetical protein